MPRLQDLSGEPLLVELELRWVNHQVMVKWMRHFFQYCRGNDATSGAGAMVAMALVAAGDAATMASTVGDEATTNVVGGASADALPRALPRAAGCFG